MASKIYDENEIKILEGLEAVRKRPGMYIGSTDIRGLHHMVYEIVDNSVDEALAGYCNHIVVTIHPDNSISITDNGRGMPIGMHEIGLPTVEVILTKLHAGGKFDGTTYQASGGLHGVGSSVVNALSERLEVTVRREKKEYYQLFTDGGKPHKPVIKNIKNKESGTSITFKADPAFFKDLNFDSKVIQDHLRQSAFLMKGLKIDFIDERVSISESFLYADGLKDFITYLHEDKDTLNDITVISDEDATSNIKMECAFQYNDGYSETILSFVNNVRTDDGGSHVSGLKTGMTKAFNEYARKLNLLKSKDKNLEGSDVREGFTAVLSIYIPEALLQFEGQTKSKLGTPQAKTAIENFINDRFSIYLLENGDIAQQLVHKALKAREARQAARKARDDSRKGKTGRKKERLLSGKLTPAQSRNRQKNELFLVEGDSAGGSAKQGRERKFQAILPLRGKVLNTEKASMDEILKNEELSTIIYTIGAGVGAEFDISACNYDKIIIMTDADTDGAHIQVLLLTFFFRYMRPLIEAGKVYIAMPPLYKVTNGKGSKQHITYLWTDEELNTYVKNLKQSYQLQRYKGLGEMNADQLWQTTMDPNNRTLIRLTIGDLSQAEKYVSILMGNKVAPRRSWIEDHVEFTLESEESLLEGHK